MAQPESVAEGLPDRVAHELQGFVDAARSALGDTLVSIVLFGSGAEHRLRATSDLNVVVVLRSFDAARLEPCRAATSRAHATIRLQTLWLLESEIPAAAEAFAVKFVDIARRHRVLHGTDPFAGLIVDRQALIWRLRQVLLNQVLRLRAALVEAGEHEDRLAVRVADAAGPLRVAAAEILELEGRPATGPKEALLEASRDWTDPARERVLAAISMARESRQLPAGEASSVLVGVMALAAFLQERAAALR
jgi:hypothetical protein